MTIWDRSGVKRGDFDLALFASLEGAADVPWDFEGNGCSFIPDDLPGPSADKCPACHIHDYDYHVGGGFHEFVAANRRLRRNLRKLGIGRVDAAVVYVGVALGGMPHFNWHGVPWHMPTVKQMDRAIQLTEGTGLRRDVPWGALAKAMCGVPAFRKRALALFVVAAVTTALFGLCFGPSEAAAWTGGRNQAPLPQSQPSQLELLANEWLIGLDATHDNVCDVAASVSANGLTESSLKAVDSASDEECLTYETTTGDFEWQACGGSAPAFSTITGDTNTTAAMVVGTGASISTSGSGTIAATTSAALASNGANCSAGSYPLGVDASGAAEGCTAVAGSTATHQFWEFAALGTASGTVQGLWAAVYDEQSVFGATSNNTTNPGVANARFLSDNRTYTFYTLTAAIKTTLSAAIGCKMSLAYQTDGTTLVSTGVAMNSATSDSFGGDYTIKTMGEQLDVDLGGATMTDGWIALYLTDADGAGADTCVLSGVPVQFIVEYSVF